MALADLLKMAITIQTPTDGALDEFGNPTVTWNDTDAVGFVQPINKRELPGGQTVVGDFVLFVAPTVTINERSRVIYNGTTYDVVGVEEHHAPRGMNHKTVVMVGGS